MGRYRVLSFPLRAAHCRLPLSSNIERLLSFVPVVGFGSIAASGLKNLSGCSQSGPAVWRSASAVTGLAGRSKPYTNLIIETARTFGCLARKLRRNSPSLRSHRAMTASSCLMASPCFTAAVISRCCRVITCAFS